jgi:hypothetical protein
LPLGTKRSGSKPPARAAVEFHEEAVDALENIASATGS